MRKVFCVPIRFFVASGRYVVGPIVASDREQAVSSVRGLYGLLPGAYTVEVDTPANRAKYEAA